MSKKIVEKYKKTNYKEIQIKILTKFDFITPDLLNNLKKNSVNLKILMPQIITEIKIVKSKSLKKNFQTLKA